MPDLLAACVGARFDFAFRITIAMKHLLCAAAAILIASFISGCATHVTIIGPARPAISPAAVRVYEAPPRHYEQIAIINSSAGTTWLFPDRDSLDDAIADLRREAAALGANGDRKSVRVGKECRSRWSPEHERKNKTKRSTMSRNTEIKTSIE